MKISVVTPSYNQGRFIEKCLASVRDQHGGFSVEHIILDNCSTDATGEALARYQAVPGAVDVRVIVEPDDGQAAAINKGFGVATGDVVCWLNTDEWYEEGALVRVAGFFGAHPDVDVVFGDCDFVDTDGHVVKRKREWLSSTSMLVFYGCYIPSCATFVRRRVVDASVLLDTEFKVSMDCDWYVRIARAGYRFAHVPVPLASFTLHETNLSSTMPERSSIERRLVQDRYGGVRGPAWLRTLIYAGLWYVCVAVRVSRRIVRWPHPS